jgi:threonine dehydrogenase-like Zn-dependent dehydrogenase
MCRAGLPTHCRDRRCLGTPGRDGCLAERFTLPLRNLVEVPRELDDDRAVFAEPLAAAAHLPQLLRVEGKPYVTVLGDTAEALLTAQVMARLNASVRLLGSDPERFSMCEKWGIKHRHISEVGRRADQDIVVDWTGGLILALSLVRPRGKVVLGAPGPADPVGLGLLVENEIELIGARGGSLTDALSLLARAEIDVLPLIGRRLRLSDGAAVIEAAANPRSLRTVIEF